MPVKIKSTSGSVTLDAQNVSGDQTLTVPSLSGGKTLLTTDGDGSSLTGVGVDGIVSSANATAITITSAEHVGIGVAAPASLLHVQADSTATESLITFDRSDAAVRGEIKYDDTAATRGFQIGTTTAHDLALKTNATERLRLTYDGRGLSQFTAKAWCNFDGSGSASSWERASHNVASYVDNGTGDYKINWSTAMNNANYSVVATCAHNGVAAVQTGTVTTSAVRVITKYVGSNSVFDYAEVFIQVFGD